MNSEHSFDKKPLTAKQQLVYDYIQSYIEENQTPPSLRDIGAHLDLSVGTVQDQVEAIRRKGYVEKSETRARSLRIPTRSQQIPILGRIHAGPLHTAFENVEGYLPVGTLLSPSQHFALRVKGDSMIDAGILEGDSVIVRIQNTAEEGDIVVARIEDETTVKFFRKNNDGLYLEPANTAYQPIKNIPFVVAGIVVEVRRQIKRWRR